MGIFSSTSATFQKKVLIEFIILCDSESLGRFGSKHPRRVSKDTLATAANVTLNISFTVGQVLLIGQVNSKHETNYTVFFIFSVLDVI